VSGLSADKERHALAEDLGADKTVNVEEEDLVWVVKELTGGLGADLVVEASGSARARAEALVLSRRRGRVCLVGLAGGAGSLDIDKIVEGEFDVYGSWGTVWSSWRGALALMGSGGLRVAPLISRKLPLEEWKRGFDMMIGRKAIKILLTP
jgi:threonine dehydrogenase-like Zn-dependent dehydrogenase